MSERAEKHALDNDFDQNERIFHYTTNAGLCGILESNSLWVSHWQTLNDNTELVHATSMLETYMTGSLNTQLTQLSVEGKVGSGFSATEIARIAEKTSKSRVRDLYTGLLENWQAFILSGFFCKPSDNSDVSEFRNGALQHWISYGQKGGFALRINPRILWNTLGDEFKEYRDVTIGLYKVDYTSGLHPPPPQEEAYRIVEEYFLGAMNACINGVPYDEDVVPVYSQFFRIIGFSKNPLFKWERESRLAILRPGPADAPTDGYCPAVGIRASGTRVIPYIELLKGKLLTTAGLIECIIVGPGEDRKRRRAALETYLSMKGFQVPVEISEIPYVPQ